MQNFEIYSKVESMMKGKKWQQIQHGTHTVNNNTCSCPQALKNGTHFLKCAIWI